MIDRKIKEKNQKRKSVKRGGAGRIPRQTNARELAEVAGRIGIDIYRTYFRIYSWAVHSTPIQHEPILRELGLIPNSEEFADRANAAIYVLYDAGRLTGAATMALEESFLNSHDAHKAIADRFDSLNPRPEPSA